MSIIARVARPLAWTRSLCLARPRQTQASCQSSFSLRGVYAKHQHTQAEPLRKQLKDKLKQNKRLSRQDGPHKPSIDLEEWDLTVGIEIHAELNTSRKLFSDAHTSNHHDPATVEPNTHVAPFDAALPGSQPIFQIATLIPAIRAALALGCKVQSKSSWDRKHYMYHDQPNGYQITQHYEPLARDGAIYIDAAHDSHTAGPISSQQKIRIGIHQVQLEQDTAKTITQGSRHLLDFNRVSHPLIEIVTLPQIKSPAMAAAVVRRIQSLLKAVDACVDGMETGGLRADVNVSVLPRGQVGQSSYESVGSLGTRTEIKNLSSFKAVEDAVAAERDRQISVLLAGGRVECETRGWSIGAKQTTLLRGKEGVVDYRYMPDPDLGAVRLDDKLVEHLKDTLPELPDATIGRAVSDFGLSETDARALYVQDDGERLDFLAETVDGLALLGIERKQAGKTVGNWILHELGGLLTTSRVPWSERNIEPVQLADLLHNLLSKQITAHTAKALLRRTCLNEMDGRSFEQVIDQEGLRLVSMSDDQYRVLAQKILVQHAELVESIRASGDMRKAMFFVGQMMRQADPGTIDAGKARRTLESLLQSKISAGTDNTHKEGEFIPKADNLLPTIPIASKIKSSVQAVKTHEDIYTVPNILTATRLIAAPVIGWLILNGHLKYALGLFAYAGITDWVDGYIARRYKLQTVVGSVIDPMADKLLMTILTVTLAMEGLLPSYLAVLILGRDVALAVAALYYRYASLPVPKTMARYWDFSLPSAVVHPTTVSKANTFLQLVLIGSTLAIPVLASPIETAVTAMTATTTTWTSTESLQHMLGYFQYLVAGTTIWSGASYAFLKDAVEILGKDEAAKVRQGRTGRAIIGVTFGGVLAVSAWLALRRRPVDDEGTEEEIRSRW